MKVIGKFSVLSGGALYHVGSPLLLANDASYCERLYHLAGGLSATRRMDKAERVWEGMECGVNCLLPLSSVPDLCCAGVWCIN